MSKPLRIAFMGTPDFTVPTLQKLIDHPQVDLVCAYTQPPRPAGRGQQVQLSPVHQAAQDHGIPVRTPVNFKNPDDVKDFEDLRLDAAVVAGFGMLLPKSILSAPVHGCINVHPSLLPRWRGVAPVQYAIWHGDSKTGVCVMQLDEKMDTGPIIARQIVDMGERETTSALNNKLWNLGADMLSEVIDLIIRDGKVISEPQSAEGATYTRMFKKEDGKINWNQSATEIDRQIRALNPWPGTWAEDAKGRRLKILEASVCSETHVGDAGSVLEDGIVVCGNGTTLKLKIVQPENKKPMSVDDAMRGGYLISGQKLQ